MAGRQNALGQPIGEPLPGWTARPRPPLTPMEGRHCRIEPLDPDRHGAALHRAFAEDGEGRMWTYLTYGPFATLADWRAWAEPASRSQDPLFHTILDRDGEALGIASYLRIDPANGAIEVGHIHYAPRLQRTVAATEAMFLMMRRVFDELGYRRYEWKCDSLNAPSRRAALRLGFAYEGLFRQAVVYRERNRDTTWYAIVDTEWPALRAAYEAWLDPANFDAAGRQRRSLGALTGAATAPLR